MDKSVLNRIRNNANELSQKQKQIAEYIVSNYKEATFLTSTALAAATGVSESTVIRFAVTLGYSGYPEFQEDLQRVIQNELSTLDRFSVSKLDSEDTLYQMVFNSEVDIINKTLNGISNDDFLTTVDLLHNKKQIVIIGFQASSCLANYVGYALNKIRPNVKVITSWDEYLPNTINTLDEDSVAIVFAFPRYPKQAVNIVDKLEINNVDIVSFTDSIVSPFHEKSKITFIVPVKYSSFIDPYAGVMCLIHSITLGVAYKDREKTKKHLQNFEEYVSENNIFN